ncbi:MAG: 50S ribosome-binding GTPase [Deltaproteobacteria bacterium]|nr:50S ribosome-binding GTPase [Deltaproteobacteria bacterium]
MDEKLENNPEKSRRLAEALERMSLALSRAEQILEPEEGPADSPESGWRDTLARGILPRLRSELPLIVGLCGGGNTGKSTLFNALAGLSIQEGSPVGPRAGLTRKGLLAIPRPLYDSRKNLLPELFEPFGGLPEPYNPSGRRTPMDEPGPPFYILTENGSPETILVDLPDMDIAANSGGYANRENSRKILAACDLVILISVNQNYSNKDIANFMRETVFAEGPRPSIFVYRYNAVTDDDHAHVRDVFITMRELLYPGVDCPPLHGCFLMRDDSSVRNGARPDLAEFQSGAPLSAAPPPCGLDALLEVLSGMDRSGLRRETTCQGISAALKPASRVLERCLGEKKKIERFQSDLERYSEEIARAALNVFPFNELKNEFKVCWREELNAFHRVSSALGEFMVKPINFIKGKLSLTIKPQPDSEHDQKAKGRGEFISASSDFWNALIENKLWPAKEEAGPDDPKPQYPPLPGWHMKCRDSLELRRFEGDCADDLSKTWDKAIQLPPDFREYIRPWVKEARKNMTPSEILQEYINNFIKAGCQIAAFLYVVGTGGTTLTFTGGKDVYVLATLPALLGCEHMSEEWRKEKMNEIIRKWKDLQSPLLIAAIKKHISGGFLQACEDAVSRLEEPVEQARSAYDASLALFDEWAGADAPQRTIGL